MSEQSPVNGASRPLPPPPPEPHEVQQAVADEPMVSIQSQIGLAVTAILAILGFIFHNDLSDLAGPIGVVALSIYGAAVSIARAMKHRSTLNAVLALQDQRLEVWRTRQEVLPREEVQAAFHDAARHAFTLEERLALVEQKVAAPKAAKKATSKAAKRPTPARKTSATRKPSASR